MLGVDRAAGRDRRDARAARGARRALHLDGLLRRRRTRPSSGAARCCTRRSSSSSPTSTGTSPTSCSSTCRPAPATSRISLAQFLPRGRGVRRHHAAAGRAAGRAARRRPWPQKVNLEVKGVIENMSWFTGDDGKRYEIFGAGGGQRARRRARACRCSARCRSCRRCARAATTAVPIMAVDPDSEAAQVFAAIAERHRRRAGAHPPLPPRAARDGLTGPRPARPTGSPYIGRTQA